MAKRNVTTKKPGNEITPVQSQLDSTVGNSKEVPGSSSKTDDRARIALVAYSLWEARGRQGGTPEEDWLRAEQQLLQESRQ